MLLEVSGLSKTFPGGRVLHDVSLDIAPGEVHALVGQNGSGKSTLIKCLSGYHEPDAGARITLAGSDLPVPYTPDDAVHFGLAFVHQDLGLIPSLSVMENVALSHGFPAGRFRRIDWQAVRRDTASLLAPFDASIDPRAPLSSLSKTQETLVAVARAVRDTARGGRVLVLDEPTAALPADGISALLDAIQRLTAHGVGVLYVSHRLNEIFDVADRVTVLRNGFKVLTASTKELDVRTLAEHMIGEPLEDFFPPAADARESAALMSLRGVSGDRLDGIDLDIRHSEILGIAGLVGSGRSELARLVYGAQPLSAGSIMLEGEAIRIRGPADAIRHGIVYVPQDRTSQGAHMGLSVRENITLADVRRHSRWKRINRSAERQEVAGLIRSFRVQPSDQERALRTLSGGNQQKVVLARWWRLHPRLILLDEPVGGVDIGAKADIYRIVRKTADAGTSIVMIDSDFEDLCQLCDRIVVLAGGRIIGEVEGGDREPSRILDMIYRRLGDAA